MPVSPDFRDFVLEQLGSVVPVTSRRMFGGVGLYSDGIFFGLIDDDVVYYKVGESSRADYERAGSKAFQPYGEGSYSMSYFELPPHVLEDQAELSAWTTQALDVARATKRKRSK